MSYDTSKGALYNAHLALSDLWDTVTGRASSMKSMKRQLVQTLTEEFGRAIDVEVGKASICSQNGCSLYYELKILDADDSKEIHDPEIIDSAKKWIRSNCRKYNLRRGLIYPE